MNSLRRSLCCLPLLALASRVMASTRKRTMVVGSYTLAHMRSIKGLTFPRVHVYDQQGRLLDLDNWPVALSGVKQSAGDAYCCVSDSPAPLDSSGPPADCERVIYGEQVLAHFEGLNDADGRPIVYRELPSHQFLIVEYYADWCAPCVPARRALEKLLINAAVADYQVVVVDFSKLAS